MRRIAGFIAVIAIFGACGGGSDALSKDEFLEKANAVCKAGNDKIEAATADFDDSTTEDDIKAVFEDTIIPEVRSEFDKIDELKPPSDMADDVDALLKDGRAAIDKIEDDVMAAVQGDEDPFEDVNKQATDLGLTECGDDS